MLFDGVNDRLEVCCVLEPSRGPQDKCVPRPRWRDEAEVPNAPVVLTPSRKGRDARGWCGSVVVNQPLHRHSGFGWCRGRHSGRGCCSLLIRPWRGGGNCNGL